MRRICKTTTALATSLSLIAPHMALAQAEPAANAEGQVILPGQPAPAEAEAGMAEPPPAQPAEAQPAQTGQAAAQQEQQAPQTPAAQEQAQQPPESAPPEPETQPAEQPVPPEPPATAAEAVQQQPAAEPAPQAEAPAPKPPVTQADEPKAKPTLVQAETPPAKPDAVPEAAARGQEPEAEVKNQPAPKPDTPAAITAADPAPLEKPGGDAPQAKPPAKPVPDAEALKKALEDKPAPQQPDQQAAGQPPEPAPGRPQPGEQRAETPATIIPNAQELQRRLEQQDGQPVQVQAPEAGARPNAVAERAAEQQPAAPAAALEAAATDAPQAQVDELRVTRENARSSAEEFATAIGQGAQADQAPQEKARDNGDRLEDLGKLLLAGAAGLAVGKMLSNDRQVALNTGDRVVVTLPDGSQQVIKDDNALLYRPGSDVRTETFDDGSTRTTVLREDGSRVVTIRDAEMTVLRRTLIRADGSETRLIDDTGARPVRIADLPAPPAVQISRERLDEAALREALRREAAVDRRFSLGQIRDIPEVRALVAPVNMREITFDTASSAITPDQAGQLATLGKVIRDSIDRDPREIYMIEGYTDAIGSDAANLALSDPRAESVALALTEYFLVPPENMVVQGYGEQFLLVPTQAAERENRRVAVRRITDLLERH